MHFHRALVTPTAWIRRWKGAPKTTRIRVVAIAAILLIVGGAIARWRWPASLDSQMEGEWQLGQGVVELKSGTMRLADTSRVFGHYDVLDSRRVRFRRAGSVKSLVLDVEFARRPSIDVLVTENRVERRRVMTWYMKYGHERQELMRFFRTGRD